MTLQQAKVLALKVLKQVMEEKLDHNNVQLAQVGHFSAPPSTQSRTPSRRRSGRIGTGHTVDPRIRSHLSLGRPGKGLLDLATRRAAGVHCPDPGGPSDGGIDSGCGGSGGGGRGSDVELLGGTLVQQLAPPHSL